MCDKYKFNISESFPYKVGEALCIALMIFGIFLFAMTGVYIYSHSFISLMILHGLLSIVLVYIIGRYIVYPTLKDRYKNKNK